MQLPIEFYQQLYNHHLSIYNSKRYTEQSGLFSREQVNLYGSKLIELAELTIEQHKLNLKPKTNSKDRLTIGDGEE